MTGNVFGRPLSQLHSKINSWEFFSVKPLSWMTVAAGLALASCNIGAKYSVGGTLTGLLGQGLVLEDNSGNNLSLSSNGTFVFSDGVKNGDAYSVTVKTQPSDPSQTCSVQNGSGTIDKADVTNVIVTCAQSGRFAFVANQLSNTLSAYTINSSTGYLTAVNGSPFASTGTGPVSLVVDPNGAFLYVANNGSNTVSVYSITSGALASVGVPIATGSGPLALTIDPTDSFLYVANLASNTVSAYTIDSSTGALTALGSFAVGREPSSLKIDPSGNYLYVANFGDGTVDVFAINTATGALSVVSGSPFTAGAGPVSVTIDPTGAFAYVANETADSISEYSIDTSGGLTQVSGSPLATGSSPESLVVDPAARYLYAANVTAKNQVAAYSITPSSGALTLSVSGVAAGVFPVSLALDPSGAFAYIANDTSNTVSVYAVDATSGSLTPVTGSPFAAGDGARAIAID
jgi:6-phosphogluconolactonase (cycloisomerase 2 family)